METTEEKIDKRTKEYKESIKTEPVEGVYIKDAYSRIEDNPGFKHCMHCWRQLPPNEDGSPKWYRHPTPCDECVNRDLNKKVGKSVAEKIEEGDRIR